jgi:hypothetical protein
VSNGQPEELCRYGWVSDVPTGPDGHLETRGHYCGKDVEHKGDHQCACGETNPGEPATVCDYEWTDGLGHHECFKRKHDTGRHMCLCDAETWGEEEDQ